jgi:histidinol-phosphate aminotransferase
MPKVKPNPHILDIVPYIAGEAKLPGIVRPAKLSSNESPLGASPAAVSACEAACRELERYPDGAAIDLREALARTHGLQSGQIVCGTGSEQLIDGLCRAYAGPGDEVLFTEHAFIMYRVATLACGATPVPVPEVDYTADVDAMLAAVTPRTRIVFIANPNNPTGTVIDREALHRLRERLPEHVMLVVDAAYCEYIGAPDYSFGAELVEPVDGNTVVLHTFSKIYGLAALRVGWARCPQEVALVLHRVRGVFNVSTPAQLAAIAALEDTAHIEKARAHNARWLPWVSEKLDALGFTVTPSAGNFVLVHFADESTRVAADNCLRETGIIVRPVANYGLPAALRITIGLEDENRRLVAALEGFIASR